jgi:hypothetical protein
VTPGGTSKQTTHTGWRFSNPAQNFAKGLVSRSINFSSPVRAIDTHCPSTDSLRSI